MAYAQETCETRFDYNGNVTQSLIIPPGVTSVTIQAIGGDGFYGGFAASMSGDFAVSAGDELKIVAGRQGFPNAGASSGGGASGVVLNGAPLIIAGGGGGGPFFQISGQPDHPFKNASLTTDGHVGQNPASAFNDPTPGGTAGTAGGNGGDWVFFGDVANPSDPRAGSIHRGGNGWLANPMGSLGQVGIGVRFPLNVAAPTWGLGGGGGTSTTNNAFGGGGGGGYSGGGAGGVFGFGGGGGSFNDGINQANMIAASRGNGYVIVTFSGPCEGGITDTDSDGVADDDDNCPLVANADQADNDQDGEGDVCDADDDNDGISDADEIACGSDPLNAGSTCEICDGADNDLDGDTDEGFADSDNDGLADCVDDCPLDADNDSDGDGICGDVDNCPTSANADQADNDQDGEGDVCDADDDNDGCLDDDDSSPLVASGDADCDGVADDCDVCAGGDDSVDNNNDGLPDCAYPPSFEDILDAWKCSNNANNVKVLICHIPPGNPANAHTICVSEKQAKNTHLDKHGDYLGPCTSCTIPLIGRPEETLTIGKVEHLGMTVFPNPANDQITIRLEDMGTTSKQINIYNNLGSLVWKGQIGPGQSSLQVDLGSNRFQSGVYTVVTQYEGEVFTEKLVINK